MSGSLIVLNRTTALVLAVVFAVAAVLAAVRGRWIVFAIMIVFMIGNLVVVDVYRRRSSRV